MWEKTTDWLHYLLRVTAIYVYGSDLDKPPGPFHLLVLLVTALVLFLFYKGITALGPKRVQRRLEDIRNRIIATDTVESGFGGNRSGVVLGLGWRRRRTFHLLDNRQTEGLLLEALELNRRIPSLLPRADIIFVFDELDKIDPAQEDLDTKSADTTGVTPGESVRRRKHEVEQLLSNIKNLITVAPCRFLFIAGRDMMDAHLADAGEVNHLYSSLFDETFYVPSFLADESDKEADDISSMVEQYVCRRLMPESVARYCYRRLLEEGEKTASQGDSGAEGVDLFELDNSYNRWRLHTFRRYLEEIGPPPADETRHAEWQQHCNHLATFLQDFIYYLAYRSAGNPKKLALHFEQFVRPVPENLYTNREIHEENRYLEGVPISPRIRFVLSLDERDQYRIQLISHIFIMLHGETAQLIRLYGDKLSQSTLSILDYLFKFHSGAFSVRDLEQMPQVLDINRAPALPQVIDVLLEKMLVPYLRRVENGVYEYRFLRYYQREISYISQFSEADAAAFNFTLDESIGIKRHFRDLLQRHVGQQTDQGNPASAQLSLPSLHVILADLHGLDKEYAEAMGQYRNALQYMEPIIEAELDLRVAAEGSGQLESFRYRLSEDQSTPKKPRRLLVEEKRHGAITAPVKTLLFYVRVLLKMGLMEEQRNQYDNAAAHYFQAHRVVDYVMPRRVAGWFIVANYAQLAVLQQPAICLAFLHAKKDSLPHAADATMNRMVRRLDVYFDLAHTRDRRNDPFPSVVPGDLDRNLYRSRLYTRQAEVRLMRSRFSAAAVSYLRAIKDLLAVCKSVGNSLGGGYTGCEAMSALAFNLSGLGDACCAELVQRFYSDNFNYGAVAMPEKGDPSKRMYREELEVNIDGLVKNFSSVYDDLSRVADICKEPGPGLDDEFFDHWGTGFGEYALKLYDLSAEAYRVAHLPAEAALSLWKLQYVLVYGLGFWEFRAPPNGARTGPDCYFGLLRKVEWLFTRPKPLNQSSKRSDVDFLSGLAFESVYDLHRVRLRSMSGRQRSPDQATNREEARKIFGWITPPLAQTSRVLREVRDAWLSGGQGGMSFEIQHMGAFPMQPRILAAFMKARFYLRGLPDDPEILARETKDVEAKRKRVVKAFFLLVDCAENGSAYEGGVDILTPHLGILYYHLHRLVVAHRQSGGRDHGILRDVHRTSAFQEREKSRFLNRYYCRSRALKLLGEIAGRHVGGHEFFHYVNNRYYLYDAFSDPYVNGLWTVDYGLVPLAEKLIGKTLEYSPSSARENWEAID